MPVKALIFDMDGTMVDSMGHHRDSWLDFVRRHGLDIDVADLMRRTTGRTGAECMRELFGRELGAEESWALLQEKEQLYRDQFGPVFAEVRGFTAFYQAARALGLRAAMGTAGDRLNIAFALQHLALPQPLDAVVGGDEGLPGKPEPALFLEAASRINMPASACIVFEDAPLGIEAARRAGMRAVAICTSHSAAQLVGPHVLTAAPDFQTLLETRFLETLHVANA
jgi:beta-phosphoglucomutase-like phosphatase (HAD superfamily)